MKIKIMLLVSLMIILWASPSTAFTLDDLPEFSYEIQQFDVTFEADSRRQGFWASRDPWTKTNKYLQSASVCLQILDWRQTLLIDDYGLMESNPILGPNPTDKKINRYFPCYIGTTILITHLLPEKYRKYWLIYCIGESVRCLKDGYELGIRISF